jgi:signal transduction histidine kinase
MLQQPNLSEEDRRDYARTVTNASQRLASLITNILKLNKLENQQIYPKKERFDLGEQLCECLLGFEDAWEAKNLEIETDMEDGVTVESDPELLSLVWNNLFSNAIKFTEDGGTVGLRLYTENNHAVVEVSDTGCGISPEVGAHIFEKFYQGDRSRSTEGNGLGLALVQRVVQLCNGSVWVENTEPTGVCFTVQLPYLIEDM